MFKSTVGTVSVLSISALLTACSTSPVDEGADLAPAVEVEDAAFAPTPFRPDSEEIGEDGAGETDQVVVLAEIALPRGGVMRFLDETPFDEEPSISVVSVDSGEPAPMDLIRTMKASPLELFAVAAPNEPPPVELVREHELHAAERGLPIEPRTLKLPTVMGTTVDANPWGGTNGTSSQCTDFAAWSAGFNAWSASAAGANSGRQHVNITSYPNASVVTGNFSTYDVVYAGACKGYYGSTIVTVTMERWDGSGWGIISGTYNWLTNGNTRYRYYGYTANSASRRIRYDVSLSNEGYNKLLLSGAWSEPTLTL